LDVDDSGNWVESLAGSPWDWKPSLSETEILQIADGARKISDYVGKPVDVMFFVGIPPSTGHPRCLAWFMTTEKVEDVTDPKQYGRLVGRRFLIADLPDVKLAAQRLTGSAKTTQTALVIRPVTSHLRSASFLDAVSSLAINLGIPIELEGSLLSHAYYVLSRSGARIRIVDRFEPSHTKQRFGKLVRDLIPLRIISRGEAAKVRRISSAQLVRLLKTKAVEEALELNAETDAEKVFEELADILEVLTTVCDLYRRPFEELLAAAKKKRAERGGFDKGLVLVETEEVPLIGREAGGLFTPTSDDFMQLQDSRGIASVEPRRVRYAGREITISLVPPDAGSEKRDFKIPLHTLGLEAKIEYSGKEVSIVLSTPSTDLRDDPNQPLLPFPE
jgi:predicted house-cleaning noncanonical NTP pyrophosphatase (MazG superfamily)